MHPESGLSNQIAGKPIITFQPYVTSRTNASLGPRPFLYRRPMRMRRERGGARKKARLSSRRILTECGCGCQIFISTPQRTVARSGQPWLLYEGGSKFCQALPHRGPGSGLEE